MGRSTDFSVGLIRLSRGDKIDFLGGQRFQERSQARGYHSGSHCLFPFSFIFFFPLLSLSTLGFSSSRLSFSRFVLLSLFSHARPRDERRRRWWAAAGRAPGRRRPGNRRLRPGGAPLPGQHSQARGWGDGAARRPGGCAAGRRRRGVALAEEGDEGAAPCRRWSGAGGEGRKPAATSSQLGRGSRCGDGSRCGGGADGREEATAGVGTLAAALVPVRDRPGPRQARRCLGRMARGGVCRGGIGRWPRRGGPVAGVTRPDAATARMEQRCRR